MGKQLEILTTDLDLRDLEKSLRSRGGVALLSDGANGDFSSLSTLDQLPIPISSAGEKSLVCYLAPIQLPARIFIESESPVKVHVNIRESHLIEFWRPFYDGRVVRPGRLYYEDRILIDNVFVQKDQAFCDWAKGVMAFVRKNLHRDPASGSYLGEDAASAIDSGRIAVGSILR